MFSEAMSSILLRWRSNSSPIAFAISGSAAANPREKKPEFCGSAAFDAATMSASPKIVPDATPSAHAHLSRGYPYPFTKYCASTWSARRAIRRRAARNLPLCTPLSEPFLAIEQKVPARAKPHISSGFRPRQL
jgi:hypothetical protein